MADKCLTLLRSRVNMTQSLFRRVISVSIQYKHEDNKFESTHQRNRIKKSFVKASTDPPWKLTVVCTGEEKTANTVLLDTPNVGYLFNCGEMTQRCILNNHVAKRFNMINHIFLTSTTFRNIGGIIGYCLSTRWRGPDKQFFIHGHRNNEKVFKLLQLFTEIRILNVLNAEWQTPRHKHFEDDYVRVEYVKLLPKSSKTAEINRDEASDTEEEYAVAYIIKIKSNEDKSKSKNIEGPVLVLECPSQKYLDCLLSSHQLDALAKDIDNSPSVIVHMSPASVIDDECYKTFMSRFSPQTYHLMLNKNSPGMFVKFQHNLQRVLNRIQPAVFPLLQSHREFGARPSIPAGNIVQGFNGLQFIPGSSLPFAVTKGLYENREIIKALGRLQPSVLEKLKQSPISGEDYPELNFLGTSSGLANLGRNPSGILVQTRKDEYILLDCGEGTLHQLHQLLGSDTDTVLSNIKAIFLSHLHYDHVGGLPSLIEARARAKGTVADRDRLCIIAPKIFLRWVANYERYFGELSSKLKVFAHEKIIFDNSIGAVDRQIQSLRELLCLKQLTPVSVVHTELAFGTVLVHEDGWKLVYSGDCRPTDHLIQHGKGCDVLIHESTYPHEQLQRAILRKHSTTEEAVAVARAMEAKFTILTHLSSNKPVQEARYFTDPQFSHIALANDFMKIRRSSWKLIPDIKKAIFQAFPQR